MRLSAIIPVAAALAFAAQAQPKPPARGGPLYRNYFAEAGVPKKAVKQKVDAAFQQLFHGDPKSETLYYSAGQNANGPLAYVTDVKHHDVRSEGMSYGMMIAV